MKRTVIAEGNFIRFVKEDGWEYVERNNCSGVVIIVAITDEGNVIFVEQYRPPVKAKVIEFPAGLINDHSLKDDESFEEAAKRELFEETGYIAGKIEQLLQGPVSGGFTPDMVTMVRARDLKKEGDGGGDQTEDIIVHEVPFNNVPQWLKDKEQEGFLIEPKIFSGLYFLENSP